MKLTDEMIAKARKVNLPDFLRTNGYDLKKTGRWYRSKEHPSLCIYDNDFGEEGKWFHHSRDKGGDNIAFLKEYMDMSFRDAVLALNGESCTFNIPLPIEKRPEEPPKIFRIYPCNQTNMLYEYLCGQRKLARSLVEELINNGSLVEEKGTYNAVFLYFDETGKAIGAEKVGTGREKYKITAWGSAPGRGFEYIIGKGESAMFFESAIDMLSYVMMYRNVMHNCRLISMMGLKHSHVENTMKRLGIPENKVYICSDNDPAGNRFYQKLKEQYPKMQRIMCEDEYKDWNDQLRNIQKDEGAQVWSKIAAGTRLARPSFLSEQYIEEKCSF